MRFQCPQQTQTIEAARRSRTSLTLVFRLPRRARARNNIVPFQPTMEVDVGAALRAEWVVTLAARLAADRAGPLVLPGTHGLGGRFVVVGGHRTRLPPPLRWTL